MIDISLGLIIEASVAILLLITIGYCILLNKRLKALHGDKNALRQMVVDLIKATDMANVAIKGLRESATEADNMINARLQEADQYSIELANHVSAGHVVIEKIARITNEATINRGNQVERDIPSDNKGGNAALQRLKEFQKRRENAA